MEAFIMHLRKTMEEFNVKEKIINQIIKKMVEFGRIIFCKKSLLEF